VRVTQYGGVVISWPESLTLTLASSGAVVYWPLVRGGPLTQLWQHPIPTGPDWWKYPGSPGLVIADPLKVYVACTPIWFIPATCLYGFPCTVLERGSGHVFNLTSVTNPGSFVIHFSPPLRWMQERLNFYPSNENTALTQVNCAIGYCRFPRSIVPPDHCSHIMFSMY